MSDFPEGSSQKKGKGRKKNEGTRKRASAIDLSVDPLPPLAVQQTHPDLYAGTSGPSVHFADSLPQPIGPFETHSEPFMNLGLDVESKDVPQYPEMVVAHRRCSSDTFIPSCSTWLCRISICLEGARAVAGQQWIIFSKTISWVSLTTVARKDPRHPRR